MNVQVALSLNIPEPLTYSLPPCREEIQPGSRVVVPVGGRLETGWIVGMESEYSGPVRPVIGHIRDSFRVHDLFVNFCLHAGRRFMVSPGRLLDASLSPRRRNRKQIILEGGSRDQALLKMKPGMLEHRKKDFPLNFISTVRNMAEGGREEPDSSEKEGFSERLILSYHRVSSYGEWISRYLAEGLSVLILTADNGTADWLAEEIPDAFAYHSSVKLSQREERWGRTLRGCPVAVTGGQSALMLPLLNLGAILVEHPSAWLYRKPEWDTVNTLELARLRAAFFKLPLIQGDSVFPLYLYRRRSFVSVEDRRKEKSVSTRVFPIPPGTKGIPEDFLDRVSSHLSRGHRVLVMVNRKKGDDFLYCAKCHQTARCPQCERWLKPDSGKKADSGCEECIPSAKIWNFCPNCGGEWSRVHDISAASVRKMIRERLSGEAPPVVTAETDESDLLHTCSRTGARVVLGTPFILRPEFRDAFDAVIYLKPESAFHFTAHDAAERIQAVVGRLRELVSPGGSVDVFSMFHFHYALKLLESEDQFLEREGKYRSWFHLPPFAELFEVTVKARNSRDLGAAMREIRRILDGRMTIGLTKLVGRSPARGFYSGQMELRGSFSVLRDASIAERRNIAVRRL